MPVTPPGRLFQPNACSFLVSVLRTPRRLSSQCLQGTKVGWYISLGFITFYSNLEDSGGKTSKVVGSFPVWKVCRQKRKQARQAEDLFGVIGLTDLSFDLCQKDLMVTTAGPAGARKLRVWSGAQLYAYG